MAIQGKSYYKTEGDVTNQTTINYGFTALTADDITVFAYTGDGVRIKLTQGNVDDYIVVIESDEILCNYDTWYDVPSLSNETIDYLRIYRTTTTQELVDFTDGAVLSSETLDIAYRQGLFAAQEIAEDASDTSPNGVQSVGTAQLDDSAVTSVKLAGSAVTATKIASNAVTTAKINAAAVTDTELATNAVTNTKILNDAVTNDKLADDAVETDKIADDAVTYAKVAIASKTQMEGQSAAGVVTPDVLKNSPLVPKCYGTVTYGSTDAVAFSNAFNVASVTEPTGTDVRRVTFTNALADTTYVVLVTMKTSSNLNYYETYVTAQDAAYFDIKSGSNETDGVSLNFVVFGSTYA